MTDVKDFFDGRARSYVRLSKWATSDALNSLSDAFISNIAGDVALDLGAGTGILISRVRGFRRRIALDLSPEMLSQIADPGVERVVGDIQNLQFPANFADLIICRQVLHYCDLGLALDNVVRVLKPGGALHIVQVIELGNAPPSWDQEWASLRGIAVRKHLRGAAISAELLTHGLIERRFETSTLRDSYSWREFFAKNRVEPGRESEVRQFFESAPPTVVNAIALETDMRGIAYDRRFGFWLSQKR